MPTTGQLLVNSTMAGALIRRHPVACCSVCMVFAMVENMHVARSGTVHAHADQLLCTGRLGTVFAADWPQVVGSRGCYCGFVRITLCDAPTAALACCEHGVCCFISSIGDKCHTSVTLLIGVD